jgi:hypothetical protein
MQFDVILNKTGYHYPQQRIIALWEDVVPTINKQKAPEPLVMRLNTFDCAVFSHTNLVPEVYEMDDYQVRTPTDIIGQHIHLPKWDLTTTDGAANGWNYEDGTLAPGAVVERIHAIREFNLCIGKDFGDERDGQDECPVATEHPFFGQFARDDWTGARTTLQRWFADPVVNTAGVDRGLGIIFTAWASSSPTTTMALRRTSRSVCTQPTSWQAQILPPDSASFGSTVQAETLEPFREFYVEFSDFQHAYEHGVYVGAGPDGRPLPGAGQGLPMAVANLGNPEFTGLAADAFRFSINPPARQQFNAPLFPNLQLEVAGGQIPGCPTRPCPQAIDVQDPGTLVANYRAEPVGLRVFDPNKQGPDGKPGTQADGIAGDLAFALSTELRDENGVVTPITRAINDLNSVTGKAPPGYVLNQGALAGDPFTPMFRSYSGDLVRVKMQAGAHEHEQNTSILGWLQGGSGHGTGPNSGWRNVQGSGISEQFTFRMPMNPTAQQQNDAGQTDYAWTIAAHMDGWWTGTWGLVRKYETIQPDLALLPGNEEVDTARIVNEKDFNGVCPKTAPLLEKTVIAILANELLPKPAGVTIVPNGPNGTNAPLNTQHVGAPLDPDGGTLVYNPRDTEVSGNVLGQGPQSFNGPLHDPTAILYVSADDLEPVPGQAGNVCRDRPNRLLRANAGDCVEVALFNRLPALVPDLPTLATLQGVVKRERFVIDNGVDIGSTLFDNNLIVPSSHVGLQPQLVEVDATQHAGYNVGTNAVSTVGPVLPNGDPADAIVYRWYMGHIAGNKVNRGIELVATPVEFGGFGLMPADKVKQGQKSLVGGMVVHPKDAVVVEDANQHAQATVTVNGTAYRDFMVVMTKDLNHRYTSGDAVQHLNGQQVGIPEDSVENSGMALNYGIEPLWFRMGLLPNAPFGNAGCGPNCYGGVQDAHTAYSNTVVRRGTAENLGDPVTPVLIANAGQEARINWAIPHGAGRGTVFKLHGHDWQRAPYVCNGSSRDGLTGACTMTEVGSTSIGKSPYDHYFNGQDSLTPMGHFTFRIEEAGGEGLVVGDYLYRDFGSFGNASGLWGILRVQ